MMTPGFGMLGLSPPIVLALIPLLFNLPPRISGARVLYQPEDKITLLDFKNFNSVILNSHKAWVVEFYASWCGHCIYFAPIFKKFANRVSGWDPVVGVAGIDCGLTINSDICRDYGIYSYPTIRGFPPRAKLGDQGKSVTKASFIKEPIALVISTGKFVSSLPDYKDSFALIEKGRENEVWNTDPTAKKAILVGNGEEDAWPVILMDLLSISKRRNFIPRLYDSKDSALIGMVKGDTPMKPIEISRTNSLDSYLKSVVSFLDETVSSTLKPFSTSSTKVTPSPIEADIRRRRYTTYMADIEKALLYTLSHEISSRISIQGDELVILQEYMDILVRYFPSRPLTKRFLVDLRSWIMGHSTSVGGKDLQTYVSFLSQRTRAFADAPEDFIACKGSTPIYGGYTCSLWMMWHAITVNHAGVTSNPIATKLEALKVFHAYIITFFGCRDCAEHFALEWERDLPIKSVFNTDDAVIWLWRVHNRVNARLSGSPTDDPVFPKENFPNARRCQSCFIKGPYGNGSDALSSEILHFLKEMYGPGMNYSSLDAKGGVVLTNSQTAVLGYDQTTKFFKSWFSFTDMGLLFIVYVISIVIIIVVYKKICSRHQCRVIEGFISRKI